MIYTFFLPQVTSLGDDEDGSGGSGDAIADLLAEISGEGSSDGDGSGGDPGSGGGGNGSSEEEEDPLELVEVSEDFYYMAHVMRLMAAMHSIVSLAMLVAYYHLKVREKEQKEKRGKGNGFFFF